MDDEKTWPKKQKTAKAKNLCGEYERVSLPFNLLVQMLSHIKRPVNDTHFSTHWFDTPVKQSKNLTMVLRFRVLPVIGQSPDGLKFFLDDL